MAKQPYIPVYIGDYIKDTRKLPLSVRGAWVDLILFMWDEPVRGEITGTIDEFSGMLSCSKQECEFALNLLIEKKVCNHESLPEQKIKIISRRMKKDAEISLKRSESGKKGAEEKAKGRQNNNFDENLLQAKQKQNTDIIYDNDTDNKILSLEGKGNFSFNEKIELPINVLEAAEMNQFTHTKNRNTEFIKTLWRIFLKERMSDHPKRWQQLSELTKYFLNFIRDKFPKNGTHIKNIGGKPIPEVVPSGGYGKL